MLSNKWQVVLAKVDYAFMPIVNIFSGVVFGLEAFLRKYESVGFNSVRELFDSAYSEGVIYELDLGLRKKAVEKFISLGFKNRAKLFFNFDIRVFEMQDYGVNNTKVILQKYDMSPDSFCFEVSEQRDLDLLPKFEELLARYKEQGFSVAIDNFSTSMSALKIVHNTTPHFLKIDAGYLESLYNNNKMKEAIHSTFNIAAGYNIKVIATEVETEEQLLLCKELGCDFVEGYFIQEPQLDANNLKFKYEIIESINRVHKSLSDVSDKTLYTEEMEYLEPISITQSLLDVFNHFKKNTNITFVPILDINHQPLGVLYEKTLKNYAYSMYGKEVISNISREKSIRDFITNIPICDINTKSEKILEIFYQNSASDGIILTENGIYVGFLTAKAFLRVLYKKSVEIANNYNILTLLPNNRMVQEFIETTLTSDINNCILVYINIENIAQYSSAFGFLKENMVIRELANLLKKFPFLKDHFVGHLGSDDFFIGFKNTDFAQVLLIIETLKDEFNSMQKNFFSAHEIEERSFLSKDENGQEKRYPLLSLVIAALEIFPKRELISSTKLIDMIATLKENAKKSETKIASLSYQG